MHQEHHLEVTRRTATPAQAAATALCEIVACSACWRWSDALGWHLLLRCKRCCCKSQEGPMADAKRKRVVPDDEQKGAARARAFLQDFSALPIDKMDPDEAVQKVLLQAC